MSFRASRGLGVAHVEYTPELFATACARCAITESMGRVGSCFDSTAVQSFFSTLEWELFRHTLFGTQQVARRAVGWFIVWYTGSAVTAPRVAASGRPSRRSSPSELATQSPTRARHEHRAPESPASLTTRPGRTRTPGDGGLNQLYGALHETGGRAHTISDCGRCSTASSSGVRRYHSAVLRPVIGYTRTVDGVAVALPKWVMGRSDRRVRALIASSRSRGRSRRSSSS